MAADFSAPKKQWYTSGTNKDCVRVKIMEVPSTENLPFDLFLRAEVAPPPEAKSYQQSIIVSPTGPVQAGTPLTLKLWLRSPEKLLINLSVKIVGKKGFVEKFNLRLTDQWQEYTVTGTADSDYTAKDYHLAIQLGTDAGTVDIADIRLN
jgi:hypothetical protein